MNELTLPQRAAVALGSSKHETELVLLVAEARTISELKNKDGREQCHSMAMQLKSARVAIEKAGKTAREDAQAFSKAVIAEEKRLIGIIEPDEQRLIQLRDGWDKAREAEKRAKEEAERQRVERLQEMVRHINAAPMQYVDKDISLIEGALEAYTNMVIGDEFQEYMDVARASRDVTVEKLKEMLDAAVKREEEAKRLAAEREALEKERAEMAARKAEQDRIEADARAKHEAEMRAQQEALEAQRIQIAEQQRLMDEQAARIKAERESLEQAQREKEEAERVAIEDALPPVMAKQTSERMKLADEMDASFAEPVTDTRTMDLFDAAEQAAPESRPSDEDIVNLIAVEYGVSTDTAMEWLVEMVLFNTADAAGGE